MVYHPFLEVIEVIQALHLDLQLKTYLLSTTRSADPGSQGLQPQFIMFIDLYIIKAPFALGLLSLRGLLSTSIRLSLKA